MGNGDIVIKPQFLQIAIAGTLLNTLPGKFFKRRVILVQHGLILQLEQVKVGDGTVNRTGYLCQGLDIRLGSNICKDNFRVVIDGNLCIPNRLPETLPQH